MEMNMKAEQLGNEPFSQEHKREEEGHEICCEAKRPHVDRDDEDGDGGHQVYMDEDEIDWGADVNILDSYRREWIGIYGKTGASFEDETEIPAMLHTVGPIIPISAWPKHMLQIFSVKVTETMGGLSWPLVVYGHVAVRDALDHKRNYLFRRTRGNCQILASPQDSSLKLTGPSRAIVLINPVYFEVDLKVKSNGTPFECEDKTLSYNCFCYSNITHRSEIGFVQRMIESTEHSTMELEFAHLKNAVEATIEVRVVEGSKDFKARFTARTAGIDGDILLLDSLDRKVAVDNDGLVILDHRVVSVEEKEQREGFLTIHVRAPDGGDGGYRIVKSNFRTRLALRSQLFFELGFCKLSVVVAWSML